MKNSNTSERLKEIMDERNIKQVDILRSAQPFCEKYGVKLAKNDLSQYVNGKVEPGQEKLTILGLALNVSEAWLMGYDVSKDREEKKNSPPKNGGLSNIKLELIHFVDGLTEEQAALALRVLKSIVEEQ